MGNLKKMLNPESVALIGASETEKTIPWAILSNLTISYKGKIFPVNPNRKSVLGIECYSSLSTLPEHVDLAVIAVKAALVPDIIEQCAAKGVDGVLIISTGFGETGEKGKQMEDTIIEISRKSGMRIIGPGSIGIIRPEIGLNTSFLKVNPEPGNIAFIQQKGELGDATIKWSIEAGIGFSTFASLGSMIDVDFGDMIDFLGDDDNTRSILLNMEHITNARKFISAARGFARSKPIIVLKSGRFPESVAASASYAGNLPGDDRVYEAAFKRVGVVRVEEVKDLFNAAQVLDANYLPRGPRLAVIGNAGTVGTITTDMLIELGGVLARLSEDSLNQLLSLIQSQLSNRNPVDLGGDADTDKYEKAIDICLKDPSVDAIMVIHTGHSATIPLDLAITITKIPNLTRKPIIVTLMGGPEMKDGIRVLHENNIPAYGTPEDAVRTCLQMFKYRRSLELLYETPADMLVDQAPPKYFLKTFVQKAVKEGAVVLSPEDSMSFLMNYGITYAGTAISTTIGEVLPVALKIGFPVTISAMPSNADNVKKEQINVQAAEELDRALEILKQKISKMPSGTYLETVTVRPTTKDADYEFYLTMTRDRDFSSVIRFGLGGIGRDIFKDCAIGLPPLNQMLARRLVQESKAYAVLQGYMGRKPLDISQLELIMINFSNLVVDFPEIAAIDIDPLVVSDGKISALDARIYLDHSMPEGAAAYPHLVITPYPTRYTRQWKLRDGTEVLLRPVRPEDEPMLLELFNSLSKKTMIERFFSPIKNMTHEMLTRFCNIDYDREIAIVASKKEGDKNLVIGISDLIIEQNLRAQFAVLIQDSYQAKGLGQKLIDVLIGIAQEKGLEEIFGVVLSENNRMLKLLKRLGFKESLSSYGTTEVVLKLK